MCSRVYLLDGGRGDGGGLFGGRARGLENHIEALADAEDAAFALFDSPLAGGLRASAEEELEAGPVTLLRRVLGGAHVVVSRTSGGLGDVGAARDQGLGGRAPPRARASPRSRLRSRASPSPRSRPRWDRRRPLSKRRSGRGRWPPPPRLAERSRSSSLWRPRRNYGPAPRAI